MAILFFGATLLHCAVCVINDICDIDFDRQVGMLLFSRLEHGPLRSPRRQPTPERSKTRPLASGAMSVPEAWAFFLILVGVFFWLFSYVNTTS